MPKTRPPNPEIKQEAAAHSPDKLKRPVSRLRRWWISLPPQWRPALVILVLIGTVLLCALGRSKFIEEATLPLGPTLAPLPTFTPSPAPTQDPAQDGATAAVPTPATVPVANLTPTSEPLCDGPPQMTILTVGSDSRYGTPGGLADVIRVVRVDFVTPYVAILTIPRDLWVGISGLGAYNNRPRSYFGEALTPDGEKMDFPENYGRINTAYFYGYLYDLPGGGPNILAQTIYYNLGLPVNHYIAADMKILERGIDAVGGVDITVPYDVAGFSAGLQHMTGEEAMTYARHRKSDNDWYRSDRQNQVLLALREKLKQPYMVEKVPELVDIFLDDTLTDLSKAQIASLVCMATQVDRADIRSFVIDPEMVTATYTTKGSFILLPHQLQIEALISAFLSGQDPPS